MNEHTKRVIDILNRHINTAKRLDKENIQATCEISDDEIAVLKKYFKDNINVKLSFSPNDGEFNHICTMSWKKFASTLGQVKKEQAPKTLFDKSKQNKNISNTPKITNAQNKNTVQSKNVLGFRTQNTVMSSHEQKTGKGVSIFKRK